MKALIRKPFHYATRDFLPGSTAEFPDAVFEEFKRERLVTEAPPEELPLVMPPAELTVPPPAALPIPTAAPAVPSPQADAGKRRSKSKRK